MAKYHINPTTGNPNLCRAKIKCRFGGESEHYKTVELAAQAFESKMKINELPKPLTNSFSMKLSPSTQAIVDKFETAGIQPLLVGGCVRDVFLGLDSKDVDIELYGVSKDGESLNFNDVKELFKNDNSFKLDEAGASFAVLKVKHGKEDFDISLPRTEKSTGTRHTDYDLEHDSRMTFEEAALRRDFTVNSMGYDPITKKLLDPYNGAQDMKDGVLRHVSDAFSDDPLRCLRAVNFASRLGYTVAPETVSLCRSLAPTYKTIARERVEEEFNKLFNKGKHCDKGLTTLHDIGWAEQIPPFKDCSREELEEYGKMLNKIDTKFRKFALFKMMKDNNRPNPMNTLESSNDSKHFVKLNNDLYDAVTKGEIVAAHRKLKEKFPHVTNAELKNNFKQLGYDNDEFNNLPEKPVPPVVTGKILIERGMKPGPDMGAIINKAQKIQDEESLYDLDKLLSRVER